MSIYHYSVSVPCYYGRHGHCFGPLKLLLIECKINTYADDLTESN